MHLHGPPSSSDSQPTPVLGIASEADSLLPSRPGSVEVFGRSARADVFAGTVAQPGPEVPRAASSRLTTGRSPDQSRSAVNPGLSCGGANFRGTRRVISGVAHVTLALSGHPSRDSSTLERPVALVPYLATLSATASRIRLFSASSLITSPSLISMARLTFPSRLELNRPVGSLRDAPLKNVSLTTLL